MLTSRLIWEFIQGEMEYVADLEAIETVSPFMLTMGANKQVFITPLREAERPIIERSRLDIFIDDAFHNYRSILDVHQRLLEALQQRQREQHPRFGMISDLILDAALNWNEAYLEYMPHYPIAKAKIDDERNRNVKFKTFLEVSSSGAWGTASADQPHRKRSTTNIRTVMKSTTSCTAPSPVCFGTLFF